ncbi:hypothetical protein ACFE04_024051 [Oxalis oulophora]
MDGYDFGEEARSLIKEIEITMKEVHEDEARRLIKEIEITINEVQESDFYRDFCECIRTWDHFKYHLNQSLGSHSHIQIVVYSLGSIEHEFNSQSQIAFTIALTRDLPTCFLPEIEVYDPVFSPADKIALKKFGCNVLSIEEQATKRVERPTLFYMPGTYAWIIGHVLGSNWCPFNINQIMILTNSIGNRMDSCASKVSNYTPEKDYNDVSDYISEREQYLGLIDNYMVNCGFEPTSDFDEDVKEYRRIYNIEESSCKCDGYDNVPDWVWNNYDNIPNWVFADYSWSFFHVNSDINMYDLLPDKPSMEKRLEMFQKFSNKESSFNYLRIKSCVEKDFMRSFDPHWRELFKSKLTYTEEMLEQEAETDRLYWPFRSPGQSFRGPRRFRCISAPPPKDWININFSARKVSDRLTGFGLVIYDDKNEIIETRSGKLEGVNEVEANLEALKQALEWLQSLIWLQSFCLTSPTTIDRQQVKLIIQGDNLSIIRWINSVRKPPRYMKKSLTEVLHLMKEFYYCVVYHIYEEANSAAIQTIYS